MYMYMYMYVYVYVYMYVNVNVYVYVYVYMYMSLYIYMYMCHTAAVLSMPNFGQQMHRRATDQIFLSVPHSRDWPALCPQG